jgi:hypothetical protein
MQRGHIKNSFQLVGNTITRHFFEKSGPLYREAMEPLRSLFQGLCWWTMTQSFITKAKYFHRLIKFIQLRMKAKVEMLEARIEAIGFLWNKCLFNWYKHATCEGDHGMLRLMQEVSQVPAKVKLFLIRKYVIACINRHAVAFIEWRLHFSEMRRLNTFDAQMLY